MHAIMQPGRQARAGRSSPASSRTAVPEYGAKFSTNLVLNLVLARGLGSFPEFCARKFENTSYFHANY